LETQGLRLGGATGCDVHLYTSRGFRPRIPPSWQLHNQEGASFGQRLENAIESLAQSRYQEIVVVGRDCKDLSQEDIFQAFELLKQHRLVLGPDHRGGCYLIGFHSCDRSQLRGIRWQRNTDFHQIVERFGDRDICKLCVKIDLDSLSDVWLLARSHSHWSIVAKLLKKLLSACKFFISRIAKLYPIENQREYWQLPPPLTS
jgi:hypothetical protein